MDEVFIQRHDLYARQLDNGRYVCVREPLTQAHLEAHLRGDITLGTYLLDAESKGRFLVLDADDDPNWRRLQGVSKVLEGMDTESYLERSRRGGHLWLFFEKPLTWTRDTKIWPRITQTFQHRFRRAFSKAEQAEDRTRFIGQVAVWRTSKVRETVWFLQHAGTANSTGIELANYGAGRP